MDQLKVHIIRHTQKETEEILAADFIYHFHNFKVLDMDNSKLLSVLLTTIINGGIKKIIINFNTLKFIDSTGIGVLINIAKMIRTKDGDLVLLNIPEMIDDIFKPVNLKQFINMFQNIEEAKSFFN